MPPAESRAKEQAKFDLVFGVGRQIGASKSVRQNDVTT
jgi:hypothetical protein